MEILYHSFRVGMDNTDTDIMGDNCQKTVDKPDCGDGSEKDKPEIEKDVDLLIDDIQGKNTEGVMLLNCSRRTVFVESAFGNLS